MKVLMSIERLGFGGKERLFVELVKYLAEETSIELYVVFSNSKIEYTEFYDFNENNVKYDIIEDGKKNKLKAFLKFFKICKSFKPDIIHTWGNKSTFYALPAKILLNIPLVNYQITAAPPHINWFSLYGVMAKLNFKFSDIIVANSYAGLISFNINKKSNVIYNGMNLKRFLNLIDKQTIKEKYEVSTEYAIIKVASFTKMKDYSRFINIAKKMKTIRDDISFIAVGDGPNLDKIKHRVEIEDISNVIFTGRIDDLESLIAACDIGILLSPRGEGISCAITEYMALGLPVIANDIGGTREIVNENNGFLINNETEIEIVEKINTLLDNKTLAEKLGKNAKDIIYREFPIEAMGEKFKNLYEAIIKLKNHEKEN